MDSYIQSVGMIEFSSIAAGIEASDRMLKASNVEVLMLKTICPGKFVAAIHGDVAAVEAGIQAGRDGSDGTVADYFVIASIDQAIIGAMSGIATANPTGYCLGVIETFSAASAIVAADRAAKTAEVEIAEVRIAMGLGGKAFVLLTGDVAAVQMSVDAGSAAAAESAMLVRSVVIPSVTPEVLRSIL